MARPVSEDVLAQIRAAMGAGRKIEAIKLYRMASGAGLAKAKKYVEALQAGVPAANAPSASLTDDDIAKIQAALYAGHRIEAVKIYRNATGDGLRESKEFIDALESELRQAMPDKFTAPPAKGCGIGVLVAVIAFALASLMLIA